MKYKCLTKLFNKSIKVITYQTECTNKQSFELEFNITLDKNLSLFKPLFYIVL